MDSFYIWHKWSLSLGGVSRVTLFSESENFWNFSALTLKKKSTVLDGFFPYSIQMITSMRRCVTCDDLWPWPISSRSFDLDFENRVCSVASTVLDGFFPNLGGWVGLWGFLWWAPSAKRKDLHGVSSGWSSVWHRSNTGLSSTQYEQIPIILGVWPFWLTPFFFRSISFWRAYG